MIPQPLRDSFIRRYVPNRTVVNKAFQESLRARPELQGLFDPGYVLTSTVVFVDICGSAFKTSVMRPKEVKEYLDTYYRIVIPEIYERGGEIDQMIGDGIIAVFGPPFMGYNAQATQAGLNACVDFTRAVIRKLAYSPLAVKCAVRQGELCFTIVGDVHYQQLTMVGNTLAELHRLEGVSDDHAVNVYPGTPEHSRLVGDPSLSPRRPGATGPYWTPRTKKVGDLKGVHFKEVYLEEYIDPTKVARPRWAS